MKTKRPSKGASKPLNAVAVITPSGAAPIPINKSISEFGSAALRAAAISPSPIKTTLTDKSLNSLIKTSCLGRSITTTFRALIDLPKALDVASILYAVEASKDISPFNSDDPEILFI